MEAIWAAGQWEGTDEALCIWVGVDIEKDAAVALERNVVDAQTENSGATGSPNVREIYENPLPVHTQ